MSYSVMVTSPSIGSLNTSRDDVTIGFGYTATVPEGTVPSSATLTTEVAEGVQKPSHNRLTSEAFIGAMMAWPTVELTTAVLVALPTATFPPEPMTEDTSLGWATAAVNAVNHTRAMIVIIVDMRIICVLISEGIPTPTSKTTTLFGNCQFLSANNCEYLVDSFGAC